MSMAGKPRLLFVVAEDWYFASHRFDLARAARDAGFDVALATRVSSWRGRIEAEGIRVFPLQFMRRSSRQPWVELRAIRELGSLYREWKPDVVHHVAAKPVIYGGLAARRAGVKGVVAALAGLGHAFASERASARLLRPALLAAYRAALKQRHVRLIVQNPEDERFVLEQRLVQPEALRVIRGSGVDTQVFRPHAEPETVPTFVLVARMLWDKGVGEFVDAARELRQQNVAARCLLVGEADPENPAAIAREQLRRWHSEGHVEWWGHRSDMQNVLANAHVACLPSYREGLPKSLLEAAACGLPLIATDVPGCREIAVHEETGLLVPPRSATALAEAMTRLASDAALRRRLGAAGRQRVCEYFSTERITGETVALYRELIDACASP
jgi:glycosyltransferase involved in cell wall biosynthesis